MQPRFRGDEVADPGPLSMGRPVSPDRKPGLQLLTRQPRPGQTTGNGDPEMEVAVENLKLRGFRAVALALKGRLRSLAVTYAPPAAKRFYRRLRPLAQPAGSTSPIRDVRDPVATHDTAQVREY